jgi:hypothetical protein
VGREVGRREGLLDIEAEGCIVGTCVTTGGPPFPTLACDVGAVVDAAGVGLVVVKVDGGAVALTVGNDVGGAPGATTMLTVGNDVFNEVGCAAGAWLVAKGAALLDGAVPLDGENVGFDVVSIVCFMNELLNGDGAGVNDDPNSAATTLFSLAFLATVTITVTKAPTKIRHNRRNSSLTRRLRLCRA